MTIQEIFAITDISKLIEELKVRSTTEPDITNISNQYEIAGHDINDALLRPDKSIMKDGQLSRIEKVARVQLSLQKLIVNRAVSFLFGNAVELNASATKAQEKAVVKAIKRIIADNKLSSLDRKIARALFSYTEVAEYWYPVEMEYTGYGFASKFKMKVAVFSPLYGDTLYPKFDDLGDMIAFSREYLATDAEGKERTYFETYTDAIYMKWMSDGSGWVEVDTAAITLGKIPVVYARQDKAEWSDVQNLIDRLEKLLSRFADTNEYHGSPKIKTTGEVLGFSQKGEEGAIIQLENGATAEYLTWDRAPESVKLEIETLLRLIFMLSQTPDISFEAVKGIGAVSGVALRMMFMDAHLKVQDKKEIFDEYLQRRTNLLKAYIGEMNAFLKAAAETVDIENTITPYMVSDPSEDIKMLIDATAGMPVISQKTAVGLSGLVSDAEKEYAIIQQEAMVDIAEPTDVI